MLYIPEAHGSLPPRPQALYTYTPYAYQGVPYLLRTVWHLRIQHSDSSYAGEDYTELNNYSSWADSSQLYGNNQAEQDKVRTGVDGFVKVGENALLRDDNGVQLTGVTINWWVRVEMMHVIFHKEHNSVASALAAANPSMDDEALFQTARLVVSALIAKIHTTQWTPPFFNHPAINAGLHFNWDRSQETQKYVNKNILGDDSRADTEGDACVASLRVACTGLRRRAACPRAPRTVRSSEYTHMGAPGVTYAPDPRIVSPHR